MRGEPTPRPQALRAPGRPAAAEAALGARPRPAIATGDLEATISRILYLGGLVSAVVIALGMGTWAVTGASGYPPGAYPVGLEAMVHGVRALRPLAVVQLGLVLLVLTPVVRVAASVVLMVRQRDWPYAIITGTVLALLLTSLVLGGVG